MMAADMPSPVVVDAGGAAVVLSDDFGALLFAEAAVETLVVETAVVEAAEATAADGVVVINVVSGAYTKLSLELVAS
jgi:hypothetical protein